MSDADVKNYSPGPIATDETLLRIIYYPQHIDSRGNLLPEAIPTQDLNIRGFSVHRNNYVIKEKILTDIQDYLSKKPERQCKGIAPTDCNTVLAISGNDLEQAFEILEDAPTRDDLAHAVIKFKKKYGRAEQRGLRNKLKNEFNNILDVSGVVNNLPSERHCINKKINPKEKMVNKLLSSLKRILKFLW